jgi:wyosine [tRNA(Phe)-imidazoG37] synthetase (radical SAM superfamily)
LANVHILAFGPVPSRRLGKSLGVNNVPPKTCSYSCVYCQLGRTITMTTERRTFFKPEDVLHEVERKIAQAVSRKEKIDYLTFVPDGEPTLDARLGAEISILRQLQIPIAVLTNASLLWQSDVREDLLGADLVSLKVDSVSEKLWRQIDRPHKGLKLQTILESILEFAEEFKGRTISETMLLDEVKYGDEFERIAEFLGQLGRLDKAYIGIPTRPPAEKWVKHAREETVNASFQIFAKKLGADRVEYLIGYEGNAFASTGNVKEDLMSITAVHPMREEAVMELLRRTDADWRVVQKLLRERELLELQYEGNKYYMRMLPSRRMDAERASVHSAESSHEGHHHA